LTAVPSQTLRVSLAERSYDIEIGTGNLPNIGEFAARLQTPRHYVLISDKHVEDPHAFVVANALAKPNVRVELLVIAPGEEQKSMANLSMLLDKMLELKADRQTVVVAVGGGVIGDLAGFVAASYARGVPFLQVPTTLLAQVDSSVGGKVGVNLTGAKNMAGAFWQPLGVLIDTAVLATLPEREYRSGLAEVVKYGVILDPEFFAWLEGHVADLNARSPEALRHIIYRSCELKADVVRQDERELTGLRAVLNYGHTFCHAFENLTGYGTYLHGEAVAIGMLCASRLAESLGRIPAEVTARQHALLTALGLPVAVPALDPKSVIDVMSRDKKVHDGKLRFVLPSRLGHVELVGDVTAEQVTEALGNS